MIAVAEDAAEAAAQPDAAKASAKREAKYLLLFFPIPVGIPSEYFFVLKPRIG